MTKDGPVKIAIRQDTEAGLIRAYLAHEDPRTQRIEISSLSLALAETIPGAFEVWKDAMTKVMVLVMEQQGFRVESTEERKPREPLP